MPFVHLSLTANSFILRFMPLDLSHLANATMFLSLRMSFLSCTCLPVKEVYFKFYTQFVILRLIGLVLKLNLFSVWFLFAAAATFHFTFPLHVYYFCVLTMLAFGAGTREILCIFCFFLFLLICCLNNNNNYPLSMAFSLMLSTVSKISCEFCLVLVFLCYVVVFKFYGA